MHGQRNKNFVHSSVNMNPSQGIYGGTRAALVHRGSNSIKTYAPHLLKTIMKKLTTDQEKLLLESS